MVLQSRNLLSARAALRTRAHVREPERRLHPRGQRWRPPDRGGMWPAGRALHELHTQEERRRRVPHRDQREHPRAGRSHHPVDVPPGQRQHHRALSHRERAAPRLGRAGHRGRPLLRVRPAEPEDAQPRANLRGGRGDDLRGPGDGPDHHGRPARRPDRRLLLAALQPRQPERHPRGGTLLLEARPARPCGAHIGVQPPARRGCSLQRLRHRLPAGLRAARPSPNLSPNPSLNPDPKPNPNQIVAPHATGVARAKELFDALTTLFDEAESKELRRAAAEAGDEEVAVRPHTRLALILTLTLT
eukprot:scaffold4813_cov77-Phaeocystis_antarctica.AAC.6